MEFTHARKKKEEKKWKTKTINSHGTSWCSSKMDAHWFKWLQWIICILEATRIKALSFYFQQNFNQIPGMVKSTKKGGHREKRPNESKKKQSASVKRYNAKSSWKINGKVFHTLTHTFRPRERCNQRSIVRQFSSAWSVSVSRVCEHQLLFCYRVSCVPDYALTPLYSCHIVYTILWHQNSVQNNCMNKWQASTKKIVKWQRRRSTAAAAAAAHTHRHTVTFMENDYHPAYRIPRRKQKHK